MRGETPSREGKKEKKGRGERREERQGEGRGEEPRPSRRLSHGLSARRTRFGRSSQGTYATESCNVCFGWLDFEGRRKGMATRCVSDATLDRGERGEEPQVQLEYEFDQLLASELKTTLEDKRRELEKRREECRKALHKSEKELRDFGVKNTAQREAFETFTDQLNLDDLGKLSLTSVLATNLLLVVVCSIMIMLMPSNIVKAFTAIVVAACYLATVAREEEQSMRKLYSLGGVYLMCLTIIPSVLVSSGSGAALPSIPRCPMILC